MSSNVFTKAALNFIYKQDGTGRDTYIAVNNGGFTINNEPSYFPGPGRLKMFLKNIF